MSAIGRNEPCWCDSGIKYKHCHQKIDEARLADKYVAAQKVYLGQWRKSSDRIESEGHYKWMADLVAGHSPRRVLDVGCGTGKGIKALYEALGNDIRVVGIDENPECLKETSANLWAIGVDSEIHTRISPNINPEKQWFELHYEESSVDLSRSKCSLVQSNICEDPIFFDALNRDDKFDLVTVWLVGTHFMRNEADDVRRASWVTDVAKYRLYVQNMVYEISDRILNEGGRLNIVDRVYTFDGWEVNTVESHRDQASVTGLTVDEGSLEWRSYDSTAQKGGMPMVRTALGGIDPNAYGEPVLVSLSSVKTSVRER